MPEKVMILIAYYHRSLMFQLFIVEMPITHEADDNSFRKSLSEKF